MLLTNYHTHCRFCDGKEEPEDYIKQAIQLNFKALGFSSHAPIPFKNGWTLQDEVLPEYLKEIKRLKEKYKDQIQVYLGLEIDHINGVMAPADSKFQDLGLDYILGSVHGFYDPGLKQFLCVDGPIQEYETLINKTFNGSIQKMAEAFYNHTATLAEESAPDILGHFDLLKIRNKDNRFFNESDKWYQTIVADALERIGKTTAILEVNTGGISRGNTTEIYPAPWMLNICKELNIPVSLNADAHKPEHIDFYYKESAQLLRNAGIKETWSLVDEKWQPFSL